MTDPGVAIVFPNVALPPQWIARSLHLIARRFGGEPTFHAPEAVREHYRAHLGQPVAPFRSDAFHVVDTTVICFVEGHHGEPSQVHLGSYALGDEAVAVTSSARARIYCVRPFFSRIYSRFDGDRGADDWPHSDAHVFNRMAPRGLEGTPLAYFFPWGEIYRDTSVGTLSDEFGFRVAPGWRALAKRPPEHKLVVVTGGSAAYSIYCLDDEMFAARLEAKLDAHCRAHRPETRFTVLNFGKPSVTAFDELTLFNMHCFRLRPDIVISHGGHNDAMFGMLDDPQVVAKARIAYPPHWEEFAQAIHDTKDVARTSQDEINALPHTIVRAFIQRRVQYDRIVEAAGGRMVWGMQPLLLGKGGLSEVEAYHVHAILGGRTWTKAYNHLKRLYELMVERNALAGGNKVADLYGHFGRFGAEEFLMPDNCHCNPAGDERVAERYFAHFLERGFLTRPGEDAR
ncbi:MAG: hypothetical protein HQL40_05330 [Alphaproteobacteria bacterium]|nr:hypothetical protein [Alphaproteobacteria bacterium]